MANTVSTQFIYGAGGDETRRHVINLQGNLDTTHESAVVKIDISTFTNDNHTITTAVSVVIEKIEWSIQGIERVSLLFDATTDDEIITMAGSGEIDYSDVGGFADPRSTGFTGDVVLTTGDTAPPDGSYDITIWFRTKQ